jgi:NAD(P)-dependent dehydrogenase (short-subunit alcohol dehydrogenase family)
MPRLAGTIAWITGAGSGIGEAAAIALADEGATTVLTGRTPEKLERVAARIRQQGGEAYVQPAELTDAKQVQKVGEFISSALGRLDILVNNAGVIGLSDGERPLVETMPLALWQRTLDVNLTGAFLASRSAIPLMKAGRWGRIVNISSRAGRTRTGVGHSNYGASKAGLIGFSRVLAGEVGGDGITVNCVAPSRVPTAMTLALADSTGAFERNVSETAVGRLGTPRDVADVVAFLASDAAAFLTGIVVDVNGGSFMPL